MKLCNVLLSTALVAPVVAFIVAPSSGHIQQIHSSNTWFLSATVEEVDTASAAAEEDASANLKGADDAIPTNLPSDCGMDYIPLANMLATGEFAEADQVRS